MAWTYQGKTMKPGRSWKDSSGRTYPPQWFGRTTDAEKIAVGWVHVADPEPYDNRFYWDADTAKNIADVDAVDEDGNAILDEDGNQVVTKGLKSNAIAQVKATAAGLLQSTDWYVTRKTEAGTAIPSAVSDYRTAVRTASETIETAITNAADHDAFMALYDVPVDDDGNPTGNAPINDWPESL